MQRVDKSPLIDEEPKHRKKRGKPAPPKHNHKHDYMPVIGHWTHNTYNYKTGHRIQKPMYEYVFQCTMCKKIRRPSWKERKGLDLPNPWDSGTKLPEQFPYLRVIEIPSLF